MVDCKGNTTVSLRPTETVKLYTGYVRQQYTRRLLHTSLKLELLQNDKRVQSSDGPEKAIAKAE